jgi:hypothetical protein
VIGHYRLSRFALILFFSASNSVHVVERPNNRQVRAQGSQFISI